MKQWPLSTIEEEKPKILPNDLLNNNLILSSCFLHLSIKLPQHCKQ